MIVMNKKGQNIIMGFIFGIILLFAFVIISFYSYKILEDVKPDILEDVTLNESISTINTVSDRYSNTFTGLIMFVFIGVWSIVLITAFVSDIHPILFIFVLIVCVFLIIVGMILGNSYEEMMTEPDMLATQAAFPVVNWLMTHLMEVSIGILLSGLLISFAKSRFD